MTNIQEERQKIKKIRKIKELDATKNKKNKKNKTDSLKQSKTKITDGEIRYNKIKICGKKVIKI
jgi:hypothetical protein